MKFMMVAYATKESEAGVPPDPRLIAAIGKLSEDMAKAGVLVGTGGLAPSSMGSRVRLSGGKVTITDGPFTESKEIVGGYAIVNVKSKDVAMELCKRFWQIHSDILGPSYVGAGEVRPMFDPEDCGPPEKRR